MTIPSSSTSVSAWRDDEVDLREVLQTLWHGRKWIIGLTVGFALLAWVISTWMVPSSYEANAYVALRFWPVPRNDNLPPSPLSIETMAALAQEEAILQQLSKEAQSAGMEWTSPDRFQVTIVGTKGVRLTVLASDPQSAAWFANRWAEIVMQKINAIYGGQLRPFLERLSDARAQAYADFEAKQREYEQILQDSREEVLRARMMAQQEEYACLWQYRADLEYMEAMAQQWRTRWAALPEEAPLDQQETASLLHLWQQGMLTTICSPTLRGPQFTSGEAALTAEEGLMMLEQLEASWALQRSQLQERLQELESQIGSMGAELAALQVQRDELRLQRDWAWRKYRDLEEREQSLREQIVEYGALAQMEMPAVPPREPVSPRPWLNALLAGMTGLFLGSVGVIVRSWWSSP